MRVCDGTYAAFFCCASICSGDGPPAPPPRCMGRPPLPLGFIASPRSLTLVGQTGGRAVKLVEIHPSLAGLILLFKNCVQYDSFVFALYARGASRQKFPPRQTQADVRGRSPRAAATHAAPAACNGAVALDAATRAGALCIAVSEAETVRAAAMQAGQTWAASSGGAPLKRPCNCPHESNLNVSTRRKDVCVSQKASVFSPGRPRTYVSVKERRAAATFF